MFRGAEHVFVSGGVFEHAAQLELENGQVQKLPQP